MDLFITGAGVSSQSGIPTFRGSDGFWTIGSTNYTPQEMATRKMYLNNPAQFLTWYYLRFAKYRNAKPNKIHFFLSDKKLITQNIDGLDRKAGNKNFICIHGDLSKVTKYYEEGTKTKIYNAPWDIIEKECPDLKDKKKITNYILDIFKISKKTLKPIKMKSLKPYVLLFDESYSDMYQFTKAKQLIKSSKKIIFMGTSFSVSITLIALEHAVRNSISIEVIDPKPIDLKIKNIKYHKMFAEEYIEINKDFN